jgi:hypothetical protein
LVIIFYRYSAIPKTRIQRSAKDIQSTARPNPPTLSTRVDIAPPASRPSDPEDAMTLRPVTDQLRAEHMNARCGNHSGLPLPRPIPCPGEPDDIANDNTPRCRRSGVAIDPMFLN